MENKSHALAAGAFVIVVAALLATLGMWLTRDKASYQLFELSSRESVTGLQSQAAVRYKGVAVGKVVRIGFDPQVPGNVLIRIAVDKEAPVSETTFATLGYQGVTGLAHIQLDDAEQPEPAPQPGPSGLPRLPLHTSSLSQLAEQGPALLGQAQEAAQRFSLLLSDDNLRHFGTLLQRLEQTTASVHQLAQSLDKTVTQRLDPALASVPAVADETRQTLQALRQAGASAGRAAEQIELAVQGLRADGGPLHDVAAGARAMTGAAERFSRVTLPRVDHAADATGHAARRLGRTVDAIGANPQSLIYGPGQVPPGPGEPGFAAPPTQ